MSGYLGRLATRGRGMVGLDALPLVRPVSQLYGRQQALVPESPQTADQVAPSVAGPATAPGRSVTVERPVATAHDAAPIALRRRVDREADVRPRSPAPRMNAVEAPAPVKPAEPVRIERAPPPTRPAPLPARPDNVVPVGPPAVPKGSPEPVVVRPSLRSEQPKQIASLERLFEAVEVEPSPPAQPPSVEPGTWSAATPSHPAEPEPPMISIGRIDISVAPPAPRETPARTRGFERYTRVRRGLER